MFIVQKTFIYILKVNLLGVYCYVLIREDTKDFQLVFCYIICLYTN